MAKCEWQLTAAYPPTFSGFAQAESESLSKNVAWGKEKSAKAGNVHFQYKKMLGYRKGEDGQPEIVPEEAAIVRRIYRRYLDGCTLGKIKRELDEDGISTAQGVECWSPAIIHNMASAPCTIWRTTTRPLLQERHSIWCGRK